MTRDETLDLLARVLQGLQVPLSIAPQMLGTAAEPLRELYAEVDAFGWPDADHFYTQLTALLANETTVP